MIQASIGLGIALENPRVAYAVAILWRCVACPEAWRTFLFGLALNKLYRDHARAVFGSVSPYVACAYLFGLHPTAMLLVGSLNLALGLVRPLEKRKRSHPSSSLFP